MRSHTTVRLLALFAVGLTLFVAEPARAQPSSDDAQPRFWIGGGLGTGVVPSAPDHVEEDLALHLNATLQLGRSLISVRTATAGEFFGDSITDYGVLYGRTLRDGPVLFSLGAGIGGVGDSSGSGLFSGEWEVEAAVGVPLEAQLFARPWRFVGIGVYGFANLNREASFAGATLGVQIGRLR